MSASMRSISAVIADVEKEQFPSMGGLSSGIYGEFTKAVAKAYGEDLKAYLIYMANPENCFDDDAMEKLPIY